MGNLFKIINTYHDLFFSYKDLIYLKNIKIWVLFISILAFIYSFYWYFDKSAFPYFPEVNRFYRLFFCIFIEFIVLICWFKLDKQRERIIVLKIQSIFRTDETNIYNLKKIWFKRCVSADTSSYLEIAEKIDKVLNIKEKYKSNFEFDLTSFGKLIYISDSKNRLLAMFMGVAAGMIALTISTGTNIYNVFDFFENYTFSKFFAYVFVYSIFIMLFILIIKGLVMILVEVISSFSERLDKDKVMSRRRSRIFINQLIHFYDLPKPKLRITKDKIV